MAICGELFISPASLTSNQCTHVAGDSSHFCSSRDLLQWNSRSSLSGTPYAGSLSFQCSTTITAVTEEFAPVLAQDSPTSDSAVSKFSPQETESLKVELTMDKTDYINRLAAEIQECSHAKDLDAGEELHSHIIECALDSDRYLGNLLVLMYGSCGCVKSAEIVFHKIPSPNVFSANILINAYVTNYDIEKARIFFDNMPERNLASWNAIVSALAKNGDGKDALRYYHDMLAEGFQPNIMTYVSAVDACADAEALSEGMKVHSAVVANGYFDTIMGTALINMYGQCGSLDSARDISQKLAQHDVLSWSAMIAACVNNGYNEEALCMFDEMAERGLNPTRSTFFSVLSACGNLKNLLKGRAVHVQMLSMDIAAYIRIENMLINMYGRCHSLSDSIVVFGKMLERDVVTWSTMIAAHSENDENEEALGLFYEMQTACVNPNNHTISIVFDVCTSMQALDEGQCVYDYSVCVGIKLDFIAAIALINMYGTCRRLHDARSVFCGFEQHGVLVWNAIISAYAINGRSKEAHRLLEKMQLKGIKPNKATLKIIEDLKSIDGGLGLGQDIA